MPLSDAISESFARSFQLYNDLIAVVEEDALRRKLNPLPSNTLGQQLWCVTGARESFSQAVQQNQWAGFSCSLTSTTSQAGVTLALQQSAATVTAVLQSIESYTAVQNRLIVDLLEHEAAHHGQIIRYIYALKLPIPQSWKAKYALQDA